MIINNLFVGISAERSACIMADNKLTLTPVTLGNLGFNTFYAVTTTLDTQLFYDTSEQHNFLTANPFESEATEDYRLKYPSVWPEAKLGINTALQIGSRLTNGYENRVDPGACCRQLF